MYIHTALTAIHGPHLYTCLRWYRDCIKAEAEHYRRLLSEENTFTRGTLDYWQLVYKGIHNRPHHGGLMGLLKLCSVEL